jgi:hypothetical protein
MIFRSIQFFTPSFFASLLFLSSCSVSTPAIKTGVLDMTIENMENGHLVNIRIDRPVGAVSALVTTAQWLIVTIEDSLLDTKNLESFRSDLIDTVEITRFPTALQLTLHLTIGVDAVEVIHANPGQDVLLSLFTSKKRAGEKMDRRKD